jgi:hypothetical protein
MTRFTSPVLFAAALGAAAVAGCAGAGDIDRTQPDKLHKKTLFFNADGTPKVFYYMWTFVDVPPTTGWGFEGLQGQMEKIFFRIDEDQLIGYRSYPYAPGSGSELGGITTTNADAPVVSFKITEHFDVKREYNPATGEQTNVISENSTDRPWRERDYMRVSWATDKLSNPFMDVSVAPITAGNIVVREGDITSPDRPIYTPDYIDVVTRVQATPDLAACMKLFSTWDDAGPWSCGPAEIGMRHSLRAVKESEYEPLEYPDRAPLLDAQGKRIRVLWDAEGFPHPCDDNTLSRGGGAYSGADCIEASADKFAKFGYFRTVRQFYDERLGSTEQGRKYYANRWNIWQKTIERTPDGKPRLGPDNEPIRIPLDSREPRQIVYYTNVEFPDDPLIWESAQKVADGWNQAFRGTVAGVRLAGTAGQVTEEQVQQALNANKPDGSKEIPDVLVLRRNSCNVEGVQAHLKAHPDLAAELERATDIEAEDIDKGNLIDACSAMEALTQSLPATNAKKFGWQRNGDLRYSFMFWIERPQGSFGSPLGYGPSSADPETGEIIAATLYEYGAELTLRSQFAADNVDMLNGKLSTDDLLSGKRISDILRETADDRRRRDALMVTPEAKSHAGALLSAGSLTGQGSAAPGGAVVPRLVRVDSNLADLKLDALKGTEIEARLMTDDILAAFVPGYIPGRTKIGDLDPVVRERASPLNWLSRRAKDANRERLLKMSRNGCLYSADYADDAIIGTAIRLSHLTGEPLFRTLRAEIFRGLADHELGHTVGLRHNFAGSTDALNYGERYWQIRTSTNDAAKWSEMGLEEHMYGSVMDYGARFNTDNHGIGLYDRAAIRFGYGELVELLPDAFRAGDSLRNQLFVRDYTEILAPDMVGSVDAIHKTALVPNREFTSKLEQAYRNLAAGSPIYKERPYKFCSDEFEGNLECKTWDMGANQTEIINSVIDAYKNYYVFSAFQRGRVTWDIDAYLDRISGRYFNRFSEAFQFYYFFGEYLRDLNVPLGHDLLKASMLSLNALGEVLQTPEPGTHCVTEFSPDLLVPTSGVGLGTCRNDEPQMTVTLPQAKPYYIDFSDDYYYRITRAGSLYEKLMALIALTSTDTRFFRVDSFADQDRFSINFYRLFKDEMLRLLSGIIRNDATAYGGYVSGGQYVPSPVVDPAIWGKATYEMPEYMRPTTRRVSTPVNKTIRYFALLLSMAQLDSTWDSTLDFSHYASVTVKGSDDDIEYAPGTVIDEFVHPQSHIIYRAPRMSGTNKGIGAELIEELNMLVGQAGTPAQLPKKYGLYDRQQLPDWQTAKAALAAAQATGDQVAYDKALKIYTAVDYHVAYRVDILNDLRLFRRAFGY